MLVVPLQPVPSQTVSVNLNNQACTINVYQKAFGMFCDLLVNDTLIIGGVIVAGTWSLLRESLDLALQAVPTGVDRAAVLDYLVTLPGVSEVHDLHIWGMSTTETALTAHLVRPDANVDDALLQRVCGELRARFSVHHATLQIENGAGAAPCALAPQEVV